MIGSNVIPADSTSHAESDSRKTQRLYYLDWLRNILIFGVFIYHILRPFDPLTPWHINNAETSNAVLGILLTINPWGIPILEFH